jgi:hypothetical protein
MRPDRGAEAICRRPIHGGDEAHREVRARLIVWTSLGCRILRGHGKKGGKGYIGILT